MENHYDRLELPVNATEQQIKMQYRRLAKRCHPDLNPNNPKAAEEFRKLHHAYTILSDPEKRQAYDASLSRSSRGYEHDSAQHYYRRASHTQAYAQTRVRPTPRRHMYKPDRPRSSFLQYMLSLSIEELFKGARRRLTIGQTHTCPRCRGKGVLGSGEKCPRCDGYTFLVSYEPTEVVIPPGVLPGTMIRVEVGGAYSPSPAFDVLYIDEVLVTIGVKEDEKYSVRDQHLYTTACIPTPLLKEGGEWKLPAPEGGELTITIPANTASGTVLTVRRQGLRNGASHRRGNLYCTVVAEDK
jgi:DnaJ-class molecular chaperone